MEKQLPQTFVRANRLYTAMAEQAVAEGDAGLVWTGKLADFLEEDVGYSRNLYTRIVSALKDMGCIERIQRGNNLNPSKWALIGAPTEYAWNRRKAQNDSKDHVKESTEESTDKAIDNLIKTVNSILGRLEDIDLQIRTIQQKVGIVNDAEQPYQD